MLSKDFKEFVTLLKKHEVPIKLVHCQIVYKGKALYLNGQTCDQPPNLHIFAILLESEANDIL